MATIAKGSITLVNVNDAYSVLLTPDSCAIKADYDGTNPDLTNAFTDITVVRGEEKQTFKLTLSSFSNSTITYQQTAIDGYTKRIRLTSIPSDVLSGALTFTITTDDEFVADVTFTYSVVRETSMLDWIIDWETNKTVIGDTYLITPKIFVGKKVENEEGLKTLTGVYIGPDDTNTAGIYGYKEGKDVFHINAKGAMIGGWNINDYGISTSNEHGRLDINSEGSIAFYNVEGDVIWKIWSHGEAEFSQGNVHFYENGDAYFNGEIQAAIGTIGGWVIDKTVLYNDHIALNSAKHILGVSGASVFDVNNIKTTVQQFGGVYMFYDNANSYGLQGYLPRKSAGDGLYLVQSSFALGSTNQIANWSFDNDSLYMGAKVNMQKKYTANAGEITIGSKGMRGKCWYIDQDGSVSFASGNVQFTENSGSIVGWNLNARRLSNPNMAIVSDTANAGIYMSVAEGTDFDTLASSSLTDYIDSKGGIYMKIKTDSVSFAAYDSSGRKIFKLRSNGVSSIADWNIENDALFVGDKKLLAGSFTDAAGSMTFGNTGIRGYKWRFDSDGSGAIAGGNIQWNKDGEVQFSDSVSLNWTNGIDKANTAANIAQKIAFGQMLNRDPEFTLGDWNGSKHYPWSYDSHVEIVVSTGNLLEVIKQYGLYAYGNGALVKTINIIGSDGTVSSSYSTGKTLKNNEKIQIMPAKDIASTDTIQIVFKCDGDLLGVVTDMSINNGVTSYASIKDLYGNGVSVTNDQVPAKRIMVSDTAAPNSTQKVMEITSNRWHQYNDWRVCGFYFANQSRANGEFIVKIVAKIPVGWKIENSHNQYGNGGKTTWITSQLGTGSYEEYMCVVKCGSTGTFSTINHFALKHNDTDKEKINTNSNSASNLEIWIDNNETQQTIRVNEVSWRVAYATVYDVTSSDKLTTTIDSHGIYTGTLRADQIVAGTIKSSLINADELLSNGKAWALKQDGSGYLASGNISWGTDGSLTMNGKITASSGQIGNFQINSSGLYNGEISNWKADAIANVAALYPGSILLQKVYAYGNQQIARVKVGIGEGADPTFSNENFTYCPSVGYFYRKMNPTYESDFYLPAVKIVSDNVVNRDVALYTEGAIVCHGGMLSVGHFNNADKVTVLDFSFGTTMLIANTEYRYVYLPKLSVMKYTLNTEQPFVVPVRLVAQYNNSKNFIVKFQDGETSLYFRNYNGGEWNKEVSMGAGDVLSILLIWDGANYFAQLLDNNN